MKIRDLFSMKTHGFADMSNQGPVPSKDIVEIEDKYHIYKRKSSNWRAEAAENDQFRNGIQWTKEQKRELERRRQAAIVVNLVSPSVDQLKAMLTANSPRFNGVPREGSDRDTAKLFSDIFAWIWDFNKGNRTLKTVIDRYSVRGLGYMMAWWDSEADFGKGEVILEQINPLDVYVDPECEDPYFRDAESIMIVRDYTGEQIQRNLRIDSKFLKKCRTTDHEGDVEFDPGQIPQIDGQESEDVAKYRVYDAYEMGMRPYCHFRYEEYEENIPQSDLDEYYGMPVLKIINTDLRDEAASQTTWVVEDDELAQWTQMMEQFGSTFHFIEIQDPEAGEMMEQPMPGPATEHAVREMVIEESSIGDMTTAGVMEKKEYSKQEIHRKLVIGGRMYFKGWMDLSEYPIVPFVNRHNGNPFPVSDVTMTKDLQKELNKIRSLILAHAANTASVKVAMPKGSTKKETAEEELGKSGISVIEYEAMDGAGPHFMYPPQLPSHFYQSEEKIRETVYEIFGIYPFMHGGQGAHSTSSGILIMDEFAQRRISDKRADIEDCLNQVAKVVIQLVQNYYTEEKVIRLVQPTGRYNEININSPVYDTYSGRLLHRLNDVTIGRYDVIVASGSTLPSNRITRLEYFMKLYGSNIIDQYEVLKNVDEVDVEGVMERMGMLQQLAGQIEQLQQQIKALEGDLQTADREAVGARKRLEVEKFKSQLSNMAASIDKQLNANKEREMSNFREGLSRDRQQAGPGSGETTPVMLDEELYGQINQL